MLFLWGRSESMPRWMKIALGFAVGTTVGVILMSPYWSAWKLTANQPGLVFDPIAASIRLMSGAFVWGAVGLVSAWAGTRRPRRMFRRA